MFKQRSTIAMAVAMALFKPGLNAAEKDNAQTAPTNAGRMEVMTIIGSREDARELPGSAYVVEQEDLEIFRYTDIQRILNQVPGVYLREEDGTGLRPNIGIRGTGTERSGKITLMEDGVLIAPAPYSNPEAYYFPTTGRMAGIEVLKGPSLLQYGPYTVGGAVNLLSTPIPDDYAGTALLEVGERGENRLLANYGGSGEQYGWLLETHQQRGDGFQNIDRSNRDTGYQLEDYLGKVRWNSSADASVYQSLELKLQYSTETSNISYLGLTDVDFADDPNRRYGLTDIDQMESKHSGVNLSYFLELNASLSMDLTGYYNQFERDWFKVDKIDGDGIADVIADANAGNQSVIDFLHGDDVDDIEIKHNNREYTAKGVQGRLQWAFNTGSIGHDLSTGLRWHQDYMDRYQPVEVFNQVNGSLVYQSTTQPSGSNNREEYADAISFWVMDTLALGDSVDLTLVLRHEHIETERKQYGSSRDELTDKRENTTSEWLPGAGITWHLDDNWQLLGGVHRGMSPAGGGAVEDTEPEISINYEAGMRYADAAFNAEVIGFYSDYTNSIRNCSIANPCSGGVDSGTEQLGAATIGGVEVSMGYVGQVDGLQLPLQLAYTYTDARITEDSDDGAVLDGDGYPYIPEHHFFARAGIVSPRGWDAYLSANYIDSMCIDFECERDGADNSFAETDSLWVFDLVSHYQITDRAQVYIKVDNLLDTQEIVSRSPAGARPNKPRTAYLGLNVSF
jgi:Fe(3+) dicitrate transport protein